MNWLDNIVTAVRALLQNRLRSALAILGIIIGVASVITMLAIGNGTHARVNAQLQSLGSNLLYIFSESDQQHSTSERNARRYPLTEEDALAISSGISSVSLSAPIISADDTVIFGNKSWNTTITGTWPEFITLREWDFSSGHNFTFKQVTHAAKVAVIGASVEERLFGTESPAGQIIRIGNVPIEVIGSLHKKGQDASGWDQDNIIYLPLSTAKLRVIGYEQLATRQAVSLIVAKVREQALMSTATQAIHQLLAQRHHLNKNNPARFSVRNMASLVSRRDETSRTLTLQLAALASVALLVGGIAIMNIMIVSVTERTREIGIRLAVGARQQDIRNQFIVEAILLCLAGGILGTLFGIGLAALFSRIGDWPVVITTASIGLSVGAAALIGIFFGFYPAMKAARLDPISALRRE